jgi:hypothetical protein
MILYIKYMVSLRCKMIVKQELERMGLHPVVVELGQVEIFEDLTSTQRALLKSSLLATGLEVLDDKKNILIERIKM